MKLFVCFIGLIVLGLLWIIIEPQLYIVKKINVSSKKLHEDHKIVFISDIHYGAFYLGPRLKKIVFKINKLNPDLIIIGGDYIQNVRKSKFNKELLEDLFLELSQLKPKNGIITVIGNHDYYLRENMNVLLENIEKIGIVLLKNKTLEMKLGSEKVFIHGIDDLTEGIIDINKLKIDKNYLNIVISHNPEFHEEYDTYFDLGLSGHTHGGQINLFGIYAPYTGLKYGQKYIKEINFKGNSIIITTKGLGCSLLPIRFFAVPEIIELNLNSTSVPIGKSN